MQCARCRTRVEYWSCMQPIGIWAIWENWDQSRGLEELLRRLRGWRQAPRASGPSRLDCHVRVRVRVVPRVREGHKDTPGPAALKYLGFSEGLRVLDGDLRAEGAARAMRDWCAGMGRMLHGQVGRRGRARVGRTSERGVVPLEGVEAVASPPRRCGAGAWLRRWRAAVAAWHHGGEAVVGGWPAASGGSGYGAAAVARRAGSGAAPRPPIPLQEALYALVAKTPPTACPAREAAEASTPAPQTRAAARAGWAPVAAAA
jgi:hypothetical protein